MDILSEAESKEFSSFLDSFSNSEEAGSSNNNGITNAAHSLPTSNSFNSNNFNSASTSSILPPLIHQPYTYPAPSYSPSNGYYYPHQSNNNSFQSSQTSLNNNSSFPSLLHSNSQQQQQQQPQFPSHLSQYNPNYPHHQQQINQYQPQPPYNPHNNNRPSFSTSNSAPLPLPYPTQPLPTLDEETKRKMAEQAKELSEWMSARIPVSKNAQGKEIERRHLQEGNIEESPPKRVKPLASMSNEGTYSNSNNEAALNHGGEEERVNSDRNSNSITNGNSSKSSNKKQVKESYPPLVVSPKKPVKRKVTAKQGSPPPSDVIDHIRNPPPASTPLNIPPSGPDTRSLSERRIPLPSETSTSNATPSKPAKSKKSDSKPILLSTEQKKANHIASEQKRRAAIRSGYEGLCSVVPSLKAAVEEFEERVKKVNNGKSSDGKKKGNNNGQGALMGGIEVGGEKVDGRAGPRSEAVVLGKSVDHLRVLLQTREELLNRLSTAYSKTQSKGIKVPASYRLWDEIWIETQNSEGIIGEDEGEWSEDDS